MSGKFKILHTIRRRDWGGAGFYSTEQRQAVADH